MQLALVSTEGMELNNQGITFDPTSVTIPTLIKDKVLLTPGIWNGYNFSKDQIIKGFSNTDWKNKKNYELIKDHSTSVDAFVGYVRNLRCNDEGVLLGDLEIWDEKMVKDLVLLKAKFGISARILGFQDGEDWMIDSFNNFSIVSTPACDNAYINLSKKQLTEVKVDSSFISGYEFARLKDVELSKKLEDKKIELTGETGSSVTQGETINDTSTNQKVAYDEEEEKKKKKESELIVSDKILSSEHSPSENLNRDAKEEINQEINMAEEETKQGEVVLEQKTESQDLSSKLDLILSRLDSLAILEKRVTELEAKKEEEKKDEEEEKPVEKKEDDAELAKLRTEVAELKAQEEIPKAMSIAELNVPKKHSALLGTAYSAGEAKLAQILLKNARE